MGIVFEIACHQLSRVSFFFWRQIWLIGLVSRSQKSRCSGLPRYWSVLSDANYVVPIPPEHEDRSQMVSSESGRLLAQAWRLYCTIEPCFDQIPQAVAKRSHYLSKEDDVDSRSHV